VSDTICCSSKFKIICKTVVICVRFKRTCIQENTVTICDLCIVKDNTNRLLVSNNACKVFLVLVSDGKTVLGSRE
jgi:hypothetical protein